MKADLYGMIDAKAISLKTEIAEASVDWAHLPERKGVHVYWELGGRPLFRFLRYSQLGLFAEGSVDETFVTPTLYSRGDVVSALALPRPSDLPSHVLLIDPSRVSIIKGPRRVNWGSGLEYILPRGFPREALRLPWELEIS